MIRWNKATALATGLIMIVLGNAVALTGAYYNRSGKPDAKVTHIVPGWLLART